MTALSPAALSLVQLSAAVASLDEVGIRPYLAGAAASAPALWVEEVLLQSYLFAGFPRALNAMREWRRVSGSVAPATDEGEEPARAADWQTRGEETCAVVYGPFYEKLRSNIRALHPALDAWMIVEGYGKVLSRDGLALAQRELCIIAACAATRQDRQLHSHLHGALHAGATPSEVTATIAALHAFFTPDYRARVEGLWARACRGT